MNWVNRFKANLRPQRHGAEHADEQISVLAVIPYGWERQHLHEIAQRAHWSLDFKSTLESSKETLRQAIKPVIIWDRDLPDCDWRDGVEILAAAAPGSVVLLASSSDEDSLWEEVIRAGGYDVLRKPFETERVTHTVHFAWMYWKFTNSHLAASKEKSSFHRLS
jgi:DNA-binding NtrC family response regulator